MAVPKSGCMKIIKQGTKAMPKLINNNLISSIFPSLRALKINPVDATKTI